MSGQPSIFVNERERRTWSEVRDGFLRAGEEFLREYGDLQGDLWNRRFWGQRKPTPAWVVEYNADHYEEHTAKIKEKLKEWAKPKS